MKDEYNTTRLNLEKLKIDDSAFVMELVNTREWIQFIGDRNIHTIPEARAYIHKIIENPAINYWVVSTRDDMKPVGIISFIKRDYLPYHDIGFAFLNEHKKQGYGFEAASTVLNDVIQEGHHKKVLATTIKENLPSIQLLQKLGFSFYDEIVHEQQPLFVFVLAADDK